MRQICSSKPISVDPQPHIQGLNGWGDQSQPQQRLRTEQRAHTHTPQSHVQMLHARAYTHTASTSSSHAYTNNTITCTHATCFQRQLTDVDLTGNKLKALPPDLRELAPLLRRLVVRDNLLPSAGTSFTGFTGFTVTLYSLCCP
jgi:hypothetical protein